MRYKILLLPLVLALMAFPSQALLTVFNPFTGKLDYYGVDNKTDWSVGNITVTKLCFGNTGIDCMNTSVFGSNTTIITNNITQGQVWYVNNSKYLYNASAILYWNETAGNNTYLNAAGDEALGGNLDVNSYSLTEVGSLVMTGLITSQNITPATNNIYSLGNTTNWWKEAYITNIYAVSINTTNLTSNHINSDSLDSNTVSGDVIDVQDNLTVAGYKITNTSGNLVVILK